MHTTKTDEAIIGRELASMVEHALERWAREQHSTPSLPAYEWVSTDHVSVEPATRR